MDEEAAMAGKVVRCHDGGGEDGAWCHYIPVLVSGAVVCGHCLVTGQCQVQA